MEKNGAIAIETRIGVFAAVNNGGGWTLTMNETSSSTTVAGRNEKKDTNNVERRVTKKDGNMMKKMMSVPKVVSSGETISADDDQTAPAMVWSNGGGQGCRILVSNTKKPLVFYLNLAKRYIKQNNYVELSALGRAIPTVVTIAEFLKKDGWATEKDITISSLPLKDDAFERVLIKAKLLNWTYMVRGLVLDKKRDNILKVYFIKSSVYKAVSASKVEESDSQSEQDNGTYVGSGGDVGGDVGGGGDDNNRDGGSDGDGGGDVGSGGDEGGDNGNQDGNNGNQDSEEDEDSSDSEDEDSSEEDSEEEDSIEAAKIRRGAKRRRCQRQVDRETKKNLGLMKQEIIQKASEDIPEFVRMPSPDGKPSEALTTGFEIRAGRLGSAMDGVP